MEKLINIFELNASSGTSNKPYTHGDNKCPVDGSNMTLASISKTGVKEQVLWCETHRITIPLVEDK
jgi:hypothetical protein